MIINLSGEDIDEKQLTWWLEQVMLELEQRKVQPKFLSTNQKSDVYRWDINLVFVDEKKMQELNRTFRNQDCVTDILSFSNEPVSTFHWKRDLQNKSMFPQLIKLFKNSNMHTNDVSTFKKISQKLKHAFCALYTRKAELALRYFFKRGNLHVLQDSNMRAGNRGEKTPSGCELVLNRLFNWGNSHVLQAHVLQDSNIRAGNRGAKTPSGCGAITPSGGGELVLCLPFIRRRAAELDFSHWLYYLIVHGVLHLFGFQHESSDRESEQMYRIQDEVFEKLASGIGEQG